MYAPNSSRDIPTVLRRADAAYASRKRKALARYGGEGVRLGYGILYTLQGEAVALYTERDPVTGEYPLFLGKIEQD